MFTSDQNKWSLMHVCTLNNKNNHIEQIFVKSICIFGLKIHYQIYRCQLFFYLVFVIQLHKINIRKSYKCTKYNTKSLKIVIIYIFHWINTYYSSISHSTWLGLSHVSSWQDPQAAVHGSSYALQLHRFVLQDFEQLQWIILRRVSGAAFMTDITGTNWLASSFQPHFSKSISHSLPIQTMIW